MAEIGQAHRVLHLLGFTLSSDRPQAYPVQNLLVAHDRADEDRGSHRLAQLGLEEFRSVRIGEGAHLEIQAIGW
ncbi:hypothetical protein D9M73_285840 [compost metagenome]